MKPFTKHTGIVVPMDRSDVDTDQLVPKQFLKRIERSGFGKFLFSDWRYLDDGCDNPAAVRAVNTRRGRLPTTAFAL